MDRFLRLLTTHESIGWPKWLTTIAGIAVISVGGIFLSLNAGASHSYKKEVSVRLPTTTTTMTLPFTGPTTTPPTTQAASAKVTVTGTVNPGTSADTIAMMGLMISGAGVLVTLAGVIVTLIIAYNPPKRRAERARREAMEE